MLDVDLFSDDQKKFLKQLVGDFGGPTSTGTLLYIIEHLLDELKSDWRLTEDFVEDAQLRSDVQVCMAALAYLRVKDLTDEN